MTNEDRDYAEEREEQATEEGDPGDELDRLVDETIREPWFEALKGLTDQSGIWVGSEDELMAEIEARAGRDASRSKDLRSYVSESTEEPPLHVVGAFSKARLEVLDHRQMTKKIREDYHGPGWGPSAPIMVERGQAGRKPFHEAAAYLMTTKYRNPLAALIVEFTYHDPRFTRNNRQWWGRTRDLAKRLSIQLFWEFGMRELEPREKQLFDELDQALKLEGPEDFRRFCGRTRTCAYILRNVGVQVSWEKHVGQKVATDEKYTFTWWTIEAPRWKKTQPY